jgi:branched-chain amino acid transport system permease protein
MQLINTLLSGLSSGFIYGLVALAIVFVWRSSRAVNFAQAGQAMLSAFVAFSVTSSTGNWLLGLALGALLGVALGAISFALIRRMLSAQGASGALIASLGLLAIFQSAAGMIWGGEIRFFEPPVSTQGFTIGENTLLFSQYDLLVLTVGLTLVLGLTLFMQRTRVGLAMRAAAFNEEVARISGVKVQFMLYLGWAIAGGIGAIAGVLIAPMSFLSPSSFDIVIVFAFTAAVVGGLDSPVGAMLGGIGTGLVLAFVSTYSNAADAPLAALLVMVVTLLVNPNGIFGTRSARRV